MNSRKLLAILIAAFAALAVACGVSTGSDPTPEVTPTAIPIDLVTADPADAEAFKASLSTEEAACYDGKLAELDQMKQMLGDDPALLPGLDMLDSMAGFSAAECYSEDTARRVYIGQVSRLAGGLSNATLNCMVEHTNNSTMTGFFSEDEAVVKDALQADNLMALVQSIFCLNEAERLAFETSLAGEQEGFRPGMINGLECVFDYRDEDGRLVVQDAIALFSVIVEMSESMESADTLPPEVRELFATVFDFVPIVVECGLVTDEDLADSGMTTDQLVCASQALKEPLLEFIDLAAADPENAENMGFGLLADLFGALDQCGIDLEDLEGLGGMEGLDGLFGDTGSGMDLGGSIPEIDPSIIDGSMGLGDLEGILTAEQLACLEANLSEEDIQAMVESGQPPADIFGLLSTCNISLDELIQGF